MRRNDQSSRRAVCLHTLCSKTSKLGCKSEAERIQSLIPVMNRQEPTEEESFGEQPRGHLAGPRHSDDPQHGAYLRIDSARELWVFWAASRFISSLISFLRFLLADRGSFFRAANSCKRSIMRSDCSFMPLLIPADAPREYLPTYGRLSLKVSRPAAPSLR